MKYDRITPEGTRDLIFEECEAREQIRSQLYRLFQSRGYGEAATPGIEFYDLFCQEGSRFQQEDMFKLTDQKGRLLVLRPDCTVPIARLTAARLSGLSTPIRLFYGQTIFRSAPEMRGKSSEVYQIGAELIGTGNRKADLEILELAARCLKNSSNGGFRMEICHIGYFRALIDSLNVGQEVKEQLRTLIEQKNHGALIDVLNRFDGSKAVDALKCLPRLFGGEEVFAQAGALFDQGGAAQALDDLKAAYFSLKKLGLADDVTVDLGLVHHSQYYTGVIFQGYLDGLGEPVLSGGRYDKLIGNFGRDLPATGFGINVDLLARRTLLSGEAVKKSSPQVLVHGEPGMESQVFETVDRLWGQGTVCEISLFDTLAEAQAYAKGRGIPQVLAAADQELDQEMNQELGSELNQELGSEMNQKLGQEMNQELGQELNQELGSELSREKGEPQRNGK